MDASEPSRSGMMVLDLDNAALDQLRTRRDPPADAVVSRIRRANQHTPDRELIVSLMGQARAQRARCLETASAPVRAAAGPAPQDVLQWFADSSALPAWATGPVAEARIENGQRFFERWSMPIAATLFCGSLPAAYAAKNGVLVLLRSSDLAGGNVNRRVAETGQMLLDVMHLASGSPPSLRPGGQGYVSARGVRLLHAIIRSSIEATGDWDAAARGEPINQEDLLGTLFTFTTVVFLGLERLGLPYDEDPTAVEDYLFTWCVIGHLLGIEPTLLPMDRATAEARMYLIADRQQQSSPAGDVLMTALLHEMELSMPWGMRTLPRALVRHLLGDEIADDLHVPRAHLWQWVFGEAARIDHVLAVLPFGAHALQLASQVVGRSMIRMYLDRSLRGDQPPFRVEAPALATFDLAGSAVGRLARHTRRQCRRAIATTKIAATHRVASRVEGTKVASIDAVRSRVARARLEADVWARQRPWGTPR